MNRPALLIALSLLSAPAVRGAGPATYPTAWYAADGSRLVAGLGSPDPLVRERAERDLTALGRASRPALIKAIDSEEPQVRHLAARILLRLPFDLPSDPAPLATALTRYGKQTAEGRAQGLRMVVEAAKPEAAPGVLLRLLREDPSDEVRWAIVGTFRDAMAARSDLPPPEQFDATGQRAPNVALAGWAWERRDAARGLARYEHVLALEAAAPTVDRGRADFVFDALFRAALRDRRFDDAAAVRRVEFARRPETAQTPDGASNRLDDLFALHATFGPLRGFGADVADHAAGVGRPQVAYAVGRLYQRRAGQPLVADTVYRAAFAAGLGLTATRDEVGEFLTNQHWNDLAERELAAVLETHPAGGSPQSKLGYANASLRMGLLMARRGDDFEAAEHKRRAMEALGTVAGTVTRVRGSRRFTGSEAEHMMWAEINWHYLRAARKAKDAAEVGRRLDALIEYLPDDEQLVLDVVPTLLEANRRADATKLFAKPYATLKARLAERPDDPERMNNLAWLCGRSGQRLDEAVALITRALAARPDHHAYLDTAAEIQFQLGNVDEAIRLETRALAGRPGDAFLTEQLARFQAAAGAGRKAGSQPTMTPATPTTKPAGN